MSNEPVFRAWTVVNYGRGAERKSRWVEVGAAWETQGGHLRIQLDALPVNGQIILLPPKSQDDSVEPGTNEPEPDGGHSNESEPEAGTG